MGYWNKRVFTSILLGILFSILFASAVDSQSDEEKSIASIPFIQPASAQQSSPPTGYIEQEPYSGICVGQYQGLICIVFSDGYVWLLPGYVFGNSENIQEDGKNVQVFAGNDLRYYHILKTNFVKIESLMTQATQGYFEQKSYSEDCDARPFGTVCIVYSDGYIWRVTDYVQSWEEAREDGKNVQVADFQSWEEVQEDGKNVQQAGTPVRQPIAARPQRYLDVP